MSPVDAAAAPVAAPPPASGTAQAQAGRTGLSGGALRRGGTFFAISQFAGMALGFVGSTVMVRVAEPQDVASYLLLLQAIMAVGLIMQLGLGPAAPRFAPTSRGQGGDGAAAPRGSPRRRL